jgi:curved DNA-binding protein
MDYYSTLGLKRGATADDIKRAYRSLAMKHHPDRGGDEKRFKEIEEAYRFLSDPQKKQIVDMGGDPNAQPGAGGFNQGPFEFHFGSGNFDDIFSQFGFGGGFRQQQRNKSVSVNVEITLEDVLTGKEINAEIGLPGKNRKLINISVPPGIEHGQQIRYQGMGDDSIKNVKPGDLLVNVYVRPHQRFAREGDSLITDLTISAWDAMLGKNYIVKSIDGKDLDIKIPAGTQPGQTVRCQGYGLPNMRTKQRGTMMIRIKVDIPKNLTTEQQQLVERLRNGI